MRFPGLICSALNEEFLLLRSPPVDAVGFGLQEHFSYLGWVSKARRGHYRNNAA
jgi:hypothetical protein